MIRVGEDDLGAELVHLGQRHGLHRRARADRHERRRLDHAVRERQSPAPGAAVGGEEVEVQGTYRRAL